MLVCARMPRTSDRKCSERGRQPQCVCVAFAWYTKLQHVCVLAVVGHATHICLAGIHGIADSLCVWAPGVTARRVCERVRDTSAYICVRRCLSHFQDSTGVPIPFLGVVFSSMSRHTCLSNGTRCSRIFSLSSTIQFQISSRAANDIFSVQQYVICRTVQVCSYLLPEQYDSISNVQPSRQRYLLSTQQHILTYLYPPPLLQQLAAKWYTENTQQHMICRTVQVCPYLLAEYDPVPNLQPCRKRSACLDARVAVL
jgi:hypothetical protein